MCFRSSNEGKKNEAPGARVNPTTEKASVKPAHRSRVPSTKAKDKAKETPAVRPHADDFSLMRQYEQLYNKIRTFSADFLGGEKPKSADLPKDIENRILRSVSSSTIPKVLNDKTLHRHVIEGLVGITISDLLCE